MTTVDDIRTLLDASRLALLHAIEGLTDREFASDVAPGLTVLGALAGLAPVEREAVERARATAGLAARPRPAAAGPVLTRTVPPQVIHDLAGARHETLTFLDQLPVGPLPAAIGDDAPEALLLAIAQREHAVALQVAAVPRAAGASGGSGGSGGPSNGDSGLTILT
ncbi:MAG: hypothetical protein DWI58_01585 [Chloroflexi bacterium]|nr:MAG: hypothetical protein DWI58_01585 [Chloroflexota bacterium]